MNDYSMSYLQVQEIMSTRPISVLLTATIQDVAKVMKKYRVSSVIVVDNNKGLVGLVTVNDIVRKVVANGLSLDDSITSIMTKEVITVDATRDVTEVMRLFSQDSIRQAPVVDGKQLVGYITLKDILRYEPALLDIAVQGLRQKEESRQEVIDRMMDETDFDDDLII